MVNLSTVEESGSEMKRDAGSMRALEIDPRNAAAHYNLGRLEDQAGNRSKRCVAIDCS